MAGDIYPRFRATAVQAAPVFLDREATISRLADWVAKARDIGADLVVFGESFIPAFPLWNMLYAPVDQHAFYRRLFENAVEIPGPQVEQLGAIARRHGVVLSVGVTEKGPVSMGPRGDQPNANSRGRGSPTANEGSTAPYAIEGDRDDQEIDSGHEWN